MDHSHMDHGDMGHGGMGHGGMDHGGGDMGDMCNMNMLFTWDTTNLCIVFKQWHVRGPASLVVSLIAVVAICAGFEALRAALGRYESWAAQRAEELPRGEQVTESTPFLWSTGHRQVEISKRAHWIKAALYAVQTFYGSMIMLLFMTYNGWVMLAVALGAFVGYAAFGSQTKLTKDTSCH